MKKLRSAQAILNASPELQVAVIRETVAKIGRAGDATRPNAANWQNKNGLPLVVFDLFREMLRHELPLTQNDYAQMFDELARVALLDCEFIRFEPLVAQVEQLADAQRLQPNLRRSLKRTANALVGKSLPPAAKRIWQKMEWGTCAADRKLAARIERILAGRLKLGRR